MIEKFKGNDSFIRLIAILLIASVGILTLSIFTSSSDGRKQIVDKNGGAEEQLCNALSSIEGVGEVNVMLEYDKDSQVKGVIVIAEGGKNPVVANNLSNGIATLYDIPISNVIVFEKEQGEWPWKRLNLVIKTYCIKVRD